VLLASLEDCDVPLDERVKIVDFGLSAAFKNTMYSNNYEKIGTLIYMAPEQTTQ
jgi:serine/threonine protein kinase